MTPDIEGTINLDGEAVRFRIHPGGQQQWGASTTVLGRTVDALTAMADAARGTGFFDEPVDNEPRGITLTREQLEAWAQRPLTDAEVEELDAALPFSSIPDAIGTISEHL